MKFVLAGSLIVASLLAAPAFAQGVYFGPNGVGVDPGIGHDRGYDRDGDHRDYRRRDNDEGRSAYEHRRHHHDDDED